MRLPAVAALAAAALLVAACADTTSGSPVGQEGAPATAGPSSFPTQQTPAPTPSSAVASARPVPSPTTWSVAVAGKKYLAFVHPGNVDVQTLNKLYSAKSVSVKTFAAVCTKLATDQTAFAHQLETGSWPAQVSPLAREFAVQVRELGAIYSSCARASSVVTAEKVLDGGPDTQALANKIRSALHLPAIPK